MSSNLTASANAAAKGVQKDAGLLLAKEMQAQGYTISLANL